MIATVSYMLFSALSGMFEAYFWAEYPKVDQRKSHVMLTAFRCIVMFPVLWYEGWCNCVGLALMFPFIHDGVYYETRHRLNRNVYSQGWMDHSTQTGALISFDFPVRLLFATLGIIVFIICSTL